MLTDHIIKPQRDTSDDRLVSGASLCDIDIRQNRISDDRQNSTGFSSHTSDSGFNSLTKRANKCVGVLMGVCSEATTGLENGHHISPRDDLVL